MNNTTGSWRALETEEDLLHDEVEDGEPPPIPLEAKLAAAAITLLVLVLAAWIGSALAANSGAPEPITNEPAEPTASWPLEAPEVVGDYVLGKDSREKAADRTVVRGEYADGSQSLILLLSRPETSLTSYFSDAEIRLLPEENDGRGIECGVYVADDVPVCAQIVDQSAILIAGLSDQPYKDLRAQVAAFTEAITE